MIWINDKSYEFINNMTIFTFLKDHKIFLPALNDDLSKTDNELCMVEIENQRELVNAKTTYLEDEMIIHTNSQKVYDYLNEYIYNPLKASTDPSLEINANDYNILLCDEELYDECLLKYKNTYFNDIVTTQMGKMIFLVEASNQMMLHIEKNLQNKKHSNLVISDYSIIRYPKSLQVNLKEPEEILAQLIKNYYKVALKITKEIKIVYITNKKEKLISSYAKNIQYKSFIDYIVNYDDFILNESFEVSYDGLISKALYFRPIDKKNICYQDFFNIFKDMGFKEKSFSIVTNEDAKEVVATYQGFTVKCLFTTKFLSPSKIQKTDYDFIFIISTNDLTIISKEKNILKDDNLNKIYRKILIKPNSSDLFRRFV